MLKGANCSNTDACSNAAMAAGCVEPSCQSVVGHLGSQARMARCPSCADSRTVPVPLLGAGGSCRVMGVRRGGQPARRGGAAAWQRPPGQIISVARSRKSQCLATP